MPLYVVLFAYDGVKPSYYNTYLGLQCTNDMIFQAF